MAIPGLFTHPPLGAPWHAPSPCDRCGILMMSLTERSPSGYTGLCEACEREPVYTIEEREDYFFRSFPPHHPSWSRHREGFWLKAGCGHCGGRGFRTVRDAAYGSYPAQCEACRPPWADRTPVAWLLRGVRQPLAPTSPPPLFVPPPPAPAPAGWTSPIDGIREQPVLCRTCNAPILARDYPAGIVRRGGRLLHAACVPPPVAPPENQALPPERITIGGDDWDQLALF